MDLADGAGAGAGSSANNDDNETQSRDFASDPTTFDSEPSEPQDATSSTAGPSPHVHYALQIETNVGHSRPGSKQRSTTPTGPTTGRTFARSDTGAFTPVILRRKTGRAGTFKTLEDFDDFSDVRQGWQPASEPGFDPNKSDGGHASMPTLSAPCEITIVDFSQGMFKSCFHQTSGSCVLTEQHKKRSNRDTQKRQRDARVIPPAATAKMGQMPLDQRQRPELGRYQSSWPPQEPAQAGPRGHYEYPQ